MIGIILPPLLRWIERLGDARDRNAGFAQMLPLQPAVMEAGPGQRGAVAGFPEKETPSTTRPAGIWNGK